MKPVPQIEAYPLFLEFIRRHHQAERSTFSRRMFGILLWCFLIPVGVSALILVLTNQRVIPASYRSMVEGVMVFFPVVYSLYYLVTQVFSGLRELMTKGGFAANLHQARIDSEWRMGVIEALRRELPLSTNSWKAIVTHFETDLERIMARTRFLTGLAGAVFYLVMQGIDLISSPPDPVRIQVVDPGKGILETVNPAASEWVGLALFLLLLYLSGQQAHQQLARYLPCARWIRDGLEP